MSPCAETSNSEATILHNYQNIWNAWCILGIISASRALDNSQDHVALRGYVAVFNTKQCVTELATSSIDISDGCQILMMFYATSLQAVVGLHFKVPAVVYLARQWLDASGGLLPKCALVH